MRKESAPVQLCEVLWFEYQAQGQCRMIPVQNVPEHVARDFVKLMEAQGYVFVVIGSSPLPEVPHA